MTWKLFGTGDAGNVELETLTLLVHLCTLPSVGGRLRKHFLTVTARILHEVQPRKSDTTCATQFLLSCT